MSITEKAKKIRFLIADVDGVMTDGKINFFINNEGKNDEIKSYSAVDGIGFYLLHDAGIRTALISGRAHHTTVARAKMLGINYVYQGFLDKLGPFNEILAKENIQPEEIAFIGDDIIDLPLLTKVGLAVCPADATAEAKEACRHILKSNGGNGCVRETAELILKAQGKWDNFLAAIKEGRWQRKPKAETMVVDKK